MSGPHTSSNKSIYSSRRNFLVKAAALLTSLTLIGFLLKKWKSPTEKKKIPGRIVGASASIGHMLRGKSMPEPSDISYFKHVIVGGGIAGLSAARWLKNNSQDTFCLLELEQETGGNSATGSNDISSYPWGAHYLPIPNNDFTELMDFLEEANVITGYDDERKPIYNEYYLCFDPEERLYIYGQWQEGLVPEVGVPAIEREQIRSFHALMDKYKHARGKDGKYAFAIPLNRSSTDQEFTELDKMDMEKFMLLHGFTSPHLHWYVDYCCKDDYGTNIKNTSSWAGIHYFASRRGVAVNADFNTVLTWPEGNAWLAKELQKSFEKSIHSSSLVYSVSIKEESVIIDYFDTKSHTAKRIIAEKCILASPQFINKRILKDAPERDGNMYEKFTYAPWFIANLSVKDLIPGRGAPLSWDNVFYKSKSLGYVNACQQSLKSFEKRKVLTYYYPLCDGEPAEERKKALSLKHADWIEILRKDLSKVHKGIEEKIENADVWIWGHGMIRPLPGFITGPERQSAAKPFEDKIFFAHSDLSGISIFEEAFHHGIRAAKELLNTSTAL
jgi:hypothetical protein